MLPYNIVALYLDEGEQVQVADHRLDHRCLLEIFLSEESVGCRQDVHQFQDDRRELAHEGAGLDRSERVREEGHVKAGLVDVRDVTQFLDRRPGLGVEMPGRSAGAAIVPDGLAASEDDNKWIYESLKEETAYRVLDGLGLQSIVGQMGRASVTLPGATP